MSYVPETESDKDYLLRLTQNLAESQSSLMDFYRGKASTHLYNLKTTTTERDELTKKVEELEKSDSDKQEELDDLYKAKSNLEEQVTDLTEQHKYCEKCQALLDLNG